MKWRYLVHVFTVNPTFCNPSQGSGSGCLTALLGLIAACIKPLHQSRTCFCGLRVGKLSFQTILWVDLR